MSRGPSLLLIGAVVFAASVESFAGCAELCAQSGPALGGRGRLFQAVGPANSHHEKSDGPRQGNPPLKSEGHGERYMTTDQDIEARVAEETKRRMGVHNMQQARERLRAARDALTMAAYFLDAANPERAAIEHLIANDIDGLTRRIEAAVREAEA